MPVRRRGPAFSLRHTILFFGLLALVLCGVGLTLKVIARQAGQHPLVGVAAALLVLGAAAGLRKARRRRAVGRAAEAVVEATHQMAGTLTDDPAAALPAGPAQDAGAAPRTFEAADYAAMDPAAFEQAVAALCERDGCLDVEVVGGAGDLGADVMATTPDGRRVVIQCKRYGPLNKVGSQDVQRFGGTCFAVHEAHVAAVVTTSEFTQPATDYAEQCGIRCVDLDGLVAWTDGAGPAPWEETA